MVASEIILTMIASSLFCVGWMAITSKGKLLYFLRRPLDNIIEDINGSYRRNCASAKDRSKMLGVPEEDLIYEATRIRDRRMRRLSVVDPFILCVICFASLWGAAVFYCIHGYEHELLPFYIINSIGCAGLNGILAGLYFKYYDQ